MDTKLYTTYFEQHMVIGGILKIPRFAPIPRRLGKHKAFLDKVNILYNWRPDYVFDPFVSGRPLILTRIPKFILELI